MGTVRALRPGSGVSAPLTRRRTGLHLLWNAASVHLAGPRRERSAQADIVWS